MKTKQTVYDPKNVIVTVAAIPMTGFADGDKITVEPVTKDNFKSHCGVDGDTTFTKVNDDRQMITIRLKPSSPSNIILEGLMSSPTLFPLAVINKAGGKYAGGSTSCLVSEKPTVKFGAEETMKEWKIIAADYTGVQLPE